MSNGQNGYTVYANGTVLPTGKGGTNPQIEIPGYEGVVGISIVGAIPENNAALRSISSTSAPNIHAVPTLCNYCRIQVTTAGQYILINLASATAPPTVPGPGAIQVLASEIETFRVKPGMSLQVTSPTTTPVSYSVVWIK